MAKAKKKDARLVRDVHERMAIEKEAEKRAEKKYLHKLEKLRADNFQLQMKVQSLMLQLKQERAPKTFTLSRGKDGKPRVVLGYA